MLEARFWAAPLAMAGLVGALTTPAEAHFILETPGAANDQDSLGNPQKSAPCGPDGAGTPTGTVTTYQQGQTITITINETIFHPGHYRVALALNDPSELPASPPVTASPNDQCASTTIEATPTFPILADGMLLHTSPFGGPQTFEVTLPDDVTCDNCTLQILEFMSSHGAPCFYHHCANIAIQEEPVVTTAATTTTNAASSSSGNGGAGGMMEEGGAGGENAAPTQLFGADDEGCSCTLVGARGERARWGLAGLGFAAALLAGRRRRRSHKR